MALWAPINISSAIPVTQVEEVRQVMVKVVATGVPASSPLNLFSAKCPQQHPSALSVYEKAESPCPFACHQDRLPS